MVVDQMPPALLWCCKGLGALVCWKKACKLASGVARTITHNLLAPLYSLPRQGIMRLCLVLQVSAEP